jgi:hypothetical protein
VHSRRLIATETFNGYQIKMPLSFLNPNNWPLSPPHEFRIYGDDDAHTWVVVDEEDYHFLIKWKWNADSTSMRNGKPRSKPYFRRTFEVQVPNWNHKGGGTSVSPVSGRTVRNRKPRVQSALYLHRVVMLRTGIVPPSPHHTLVDHKDGQRLNCRRSNLHWATVKMNNNNRFGNAAMELV